VYPVRKGESLTDVIKKRNITVQEMKELNPGVNLDKLKGEALPPEILAVYHTCI
jgi:LysM repeat protein